MLYRSTNMNRISNYFTFFDKENNREVEKVLYSHYKHLLKICGIFPSLNKKYFKWSMMQYALFNVILLYHCIILSTTTYFVRKNITLFNLSFHYSLLIILCTLLLTVTFLKRNKFYRIYEIITSGFYNYNEPVDEYVSETKSKIEREKYYLGFLPVYIVVLSAVIIIIGPTVDKFTGQSYDDIKLTKSINLELPIKAWLPFDASEGIAYYLSLFGQITVAALVGGVIGTMDLVYINSVQELILQLLILNNSIKKLEKRARNKFKEIYSDANEIKDYYDDERYHRCYFYCLKQNIVHHQIIKKYFDEFQSYLGLLLFPVFSTATIVIALSMNEMAQESKNMGSGLVSSLMVLGEILNTLLICIYGEKVTTLSNDLRDAIYSIKWYNSIRNPYIKNVIPMVQEFTKKSLHISDAFAKANLEAFSTVMNSAYSYFNLLSASKRS